MLGHLKPISSQGRQEYREFYCGICANLRQEFGLAYSLLINNELSLILHALSPFSQWESKKTPCPAVGFLKKNSYQDSFISKKAAQISVLLAWVKAKDWASDEKYIGKDFFEKLLSEKSKKIQLSEDLEKILSDYLLLIQKNEDFDALRKASAGLSRQIFLELASLTSIDEKNKTELAQLFENAGEAILVADHLIDLENDIKYHKYNGIVENSEKKQSDIFSEKQNLQTQLNRLVLKSKQILKKIGTQNPLFVSQMASALQSISKKANGQKISCAAPKKSWRTVLQAKDWNCCLSCCECMCDACAQGSCDCLCDACCNNSDSCCNGCCDNCCDDCCGNNTTVTPSDSSTIPDDPLYDQSIKDSLGNISSDTLAPENPEMPDIDEKPENREVPSDQKPASQPSNKPSMPFE